MDRVRRCVRSSCFWVPTRKRLKIRPRNPEGFTLVELMFLIAVIGILVSIALPAYHAYSLGENASYESR
ncbi:MAG: prepilin-type N-terminal cleavage/methylation domain-containing protein [Pseudomonadota bacterium]